MRDCVVDRVNPALPPLLLLDSEDEAPLPIEEVTLLASPPTARLNDSVALSDRLSKLLVQNRFILNEEATTISQLLALGD